MTLTKGSSFINRRIIHYQKKESEIIMVFANRFGGCGDDARTLCLAVVLALVLVGTGLQASERKELGEILKQKYKGTQVTVMVNGMYAGETQKVIFSPREAGVTWIHYHESLPMSMGKTIVDQIDDRTYSTRGIINRVGTNTFPVDKGEPLAVIGADFGCSHKMCILYLDLATAKVSRVSGLDPMKATRVSPGIGGAFEHVGLGCRFSFAFSDTIADVGATETIIAAIGKYLLPSGAAVKILEEAKNIEITLGSSEEDVVKKLGEPLRSVKVGAQKFLKFKDMTVILIDGKVTSVKVE